MGNNFIRTGLQRIYALLFTNGVAFVAAVVLDTSESCVGFGAECAGVVLAEDGQR